MNSAGAAQVIHLLKLGPHSPLRQGSRTFSASSRVLAAIGGRGKALATDSYVCVQVAIPREQIYAIREHLPVNEAATEYAGQLLRLDEQVLPRNAEGECLSCSIRLPVHTVFQRVSNGKPPFVSLEQSVI